MSKIKVDIARQDVYFQITEKIIRKLNEGVVPWRKTWVSESSQAMNYISRKPYSLLNQFLLDRSGEYLTFNQIQSLGGRVKKGAKAEYIYFFKPIDKTRTVLDENGDERLETFSYPILRCYAVFHLSDVEGIESKLTPAVTFDNERISRAEDVVNNYLSRENIELKINNTATCPVYNLTRDYISSPALDHFESSNFYYAALFHEMAHSTGHERRLNRDMSASRAREELVAEMSAAMLSSLTGIANEALNDNNVGYIQHWIRELEQDKHMVVWAATRASRAVEFIIDNSAAAPERC